jgi:hypothetical protein
MPPPTPGKPRSSEAGSSKDGPVFLILTVITVDTWLWHGLSMMLTTITVLSG